MTLATTADTTVVDQTPKPATPELDQNGNSDVKLNGEAAKESAQNGQYSSS